MEKNVINLLRSIRSFAEDAKFTGSNKEDVYQAAEDYNAILEKAKKEYPDLEVWELIKPLSRDNLSCNNLMYNSSKLIKILDSIQDEDVLNNTWIIKEDTKFKAKYVGTVIVEEGYTLELLGKIGGKVVVKKEANFICKGVLQGKLEYYRDGNIEILGAVKGDIVLLENNE